MQQPTEAVPSFTGVAALSSRNEEAAEREPYKGLMPYEEEDAPFFFGRDKWRDILIDNLMASRLTVAYGGSGVGKSSVLRAGVAYHLRKLARQNLKEWGKPTIAVVVFSAWRDDPLTGLIQQIGTDIASLYERRPQAPEAVSSTLAGALRMGIERVSGEEEKGELFVILDQFEEYFLYHSQEDGEGTFAVDFPRAVNDPDLAVSFLISLRDDSLAKLDRFKGRIPLSNRLCIEPLDEEAGSEAIRKPLHEYNRCQRLGQAPVGIEPELVQAVLDQVKTGQVLLSQEGRGAVVVRPGMPAVGHIETPYLQLVMTRLWREEMASGSRRLRCATLQQLGGAVQIVKAHLSARMNQFPPELQDIAAHLFTHLVTPSGAKIAHTASDLVDYVTEEWRESHLRPDRKHVESVLTRLSSGESRILRPVGPSPNDPQAEERYEIFHDVLARAILDWRLQYLQRHERREAEAKTEDQRRRAEEKATQAARFRLLSIGLIFVLVFAGWQWRNASQQARMATARALAAGAISNLGRDPELSLLLAHRAVLTTYAVDKTTLPDVIDTLQQAVQASRIQLTLPGYGQKLTAIAYNPEGTRLATGSADGTASVWDASSGTLLFRLIAGLPGLTWTTGIDTLNAPVRYPWPSSGPLFKQSHAERVHDVAFNLNGTLLATGGGDHLARIWDANSGRELLVLVGHTGPVTAVAFSPDGKKLVTGSRDSTARVWDAASGEQLLCLAVNVVNMNWTVDSGEWKPYVPHNALKLDTWNWVKSVAFSPDGTRLVTASLDKMARVWSSTSGELLFTLEGHQKGLETVAFSPSGKWLATGSRQRMMNTWIVRARD